MLMLVFVALRFSLQNYSSDIFPTSTFVFRYSKFAHCRNFLSPPQAPVDIFIRFHNIITFVPRAHLIFLH